MLTLKQYVFYISHDIFYQNTPSICSCSISTVGFQNTIGSNQPNSTQTVRTVLRPFWRLCISPCWFFADTFWYVWKCTAACHEISSACFHLLRLSKDFGKLHVQNKQVHFWWISLLWVDFVLSEVKALPWSYCRVSTTFYPHHFSTFHSVNCNYNLTPSC